MLPYKRLFNTVQNKLFPLLVILLFTLSFCNAQTGVPQHKSYDWAKIIQVDIDPARYPGKFKAISDILNNMAGDAAGTEIFENIAKNKQGILKIKDKEDVVNASTIQGVDAMYSADYGIRLIKQDMKYDPIDNDLVINFTKSGEMLSFDEQTHHFFKVSLNNVIATELERAGWEPTDAEKNCRLLISKMNVAENYLFNNYKDLMGAKFTADDIEHCRHQRVTIFNLNANKNETFTFTDIVTDALKEYRNYAEDQRKNAYALDTRETPLARKYATKLGEPHRSREPVFNVRLGENRYRDLQFGPATGTDYISLTAGQQNEYKNLMVYYDDAHQEPVDNVTVLTRIKEEYIAQLKYDTKALNSRKMLEYADRLKKSFNEHYKANTDYQSVMNKEVEKVTKNNPYLEGANEVILAETLYAASKKNKR